MPKSKHAPALFELIGNRDEKKATDKLAVPKWLKTTPPQEQPRPEPPAAAEPATDSVRQPAPVATVPLRPTSPETVDPRDDGLPVARVRSGRIELSLNPTNAIIGGGIILILLLCVYFVGQGIGAKGKASVQIAGGGPAPTDNIGMAMQQPANGDILKTQRHPTTLMAPRLVSKGEADRASEKPQVEKAPTPVPAAAPAAAVPSSGLNRIVVERFKVTHRESAEHVQKWLAENYNFKTELRTIGDSIWLVTVGGLDLNQPGQKEIRDTLIEQLKSLGKECAKELASHNLPRYTLSGPEVHRFDK